MGDKRPFDVLNNALNNSVLVALKNRKELRGTLVSFDVHMNIVLENTEEMEDGETKRKLGTMFVRGDTIIFISPA